MGSKLGALLALVAFVMYLIAYMFITLLQLAGKGVVLKPETVMWRGLVLMVVFWVIGQVVGYVAGKLFTEIEADRNFKNTLYHSRMWLPEMGGQESGLEHDASSMKKMMQGE